MSAMHLYLTEGPRSQLYRSHAGFGPCSRCGRVAEVWNYLLPVNVYGQALKPGELGPSSAGLAPGGFCRRSCFELACKENLGR